MESKVLAVSNIVVIVCAVVAAGAVLFWAPPCTGTLELANGNMMPMRCAYTGKIALLACLLLVVAAVSSLVMRRPLTAVIVALSIALAVLTVETPLTIGICKSSDMACHTTAFWLHGCAAVSAIAALAGFVLDPGRKRVGQ